MKHVFHVLIIFSFLFLITVVCDDIFAKSIITTRASYSTKTHFHKLTRKPQKEPCHPFNPFCIPCKVGINLARTSLDHIVFIHKGITSICSKVLGRHKICDAMIDLTKFYLDHTPTDRVCKRFFLCGNKGMWDWWLDSEHQYNLSAPKSSLLQILNTPSNRTTSDEFVIIRSEIVSFMQSSKDFNISDFPENIDYQIADFIVSLLNAVEIIEKSDVFIKY